jgi:hypothetical protein
MRRLIRGLKGIELNQGSGVDQKNQNQRRMRRNSFNPLTLYLVSVTDHRRNQRQGGEVMFIEVSGMEDPAGGYEVLSKPPLGKCSINISFRSGLRSVRIPPDVTFTNSSVFFGTVLA